MFGPVAEGKVVIILQTMLVQLATPTVGHPNTGHPLSNIPILGHLLYNIDMMRIEIIAT